MEMIKYCVTRLLVIKNNGLTAIQVHQNMFPCVKIGENGDLHSVGPVIFLQPSWSQIFTNSKYENSEINLREVNFMMKTYDLTRKIEKKHVSRDKIQKINLTRILWAGRCNRARTVK